MPNTPPPFDYSYSNSGSESGTPYSNYSGDSPLSDIEYLGESQLAEYLGVSRMSDASLVDAESPFVEIKAESSPDVPLSNEKSTQTDEIKLEAAETQTDAPALSIAQTQTITIAPNPLETEQFDEEKLSARIGKIRQLFIDTSDQQVLTTQFGSFDYYDAEDLNRPESSHYSSYADDEMEQKYDSPQEPLIFVDYEKRYWEDNFTHFKNEFLKSYEYFVEVENQINLLNSESLSPFFLLGVDTYKSKKNDSFSETCNKLELSLSYMQPRLKSSFENLLNRELNIVDENNLKLTVRHARTIIENLYATANHICTLLEKESASDVVLLQFVNKAFNKMDVQVAKVGPVVEKALVDLQQQKDVEKTFKEKPRTFKLD